MANLKVPSELRFERLAELPGDGSTIVASVTLPGKVELAPTSPWIIEDVPGGTFILLLTRLLTHV